MNKQQLAKAVRDFDRRIAALPIGFIAKALPEVRTLPVRPSGSSLENMKARQLPKQTGWEQRHSEKTRE